MTAPSRESALRLVDALVEPRSVVVVGASADPAKSSSRPLRYLADLGYDGSVTVVNPRHDSVLGFPAIPEVGAMTEGSAQAAIVNLAAAAVTPALRELDRRGTEVAVVIGSGFESADSAPRAELRAFLDQPARGLRVVGPNCVGTMSTRSGAHLNFSSVLQTTPPRPGSIALVTQSGATGNGILMSLVARGVGLAHWFSTGNELDVGALEAVAGLLQRDDVSTIGLFLEAITDLEWLPIVTELMAQTGKQVFVVKVAESDLGQVAAGGHTGRIVGSADVSHAVLDHAGFVRASSIAELCDCLVLAEVVGPMPRPTRLSVASVSGASAVIVSDGVHASDNLTLAAWDETTTEEIGRRSDGRLEAPSNPLDVPFLGETETFAGLLTMLAGADDSDVVLAVESSLAHDREQLAAVLAGREEAGGPVVLTHLSEDDVVPAALVARLAEAGVAVVPTPERSVRALDLVAGGAARGTEEAAPPEVDDASTSDRDEPAAGQLGLDDVAGLVPDDFSWAPWTVVHDLEGAQVAADRYGYPVAVKAAGRTISHRSELGAVAFVHGPDELAAAYPQVATACRDHGDVVVVQAGAPAGDEVLLAVLQDPEYGAVAILRAGGVLVELLDAQVILWHGWSPEERRRVLGRSRVGRLLGGYRGRAAGDLEALSRVVDDLLEVVAAADLDLLELNPLIVLPEGTRAVDALAYTKRNGEGS